MSTKANIESDSDVETMYLTRTAAYGKGHTAFDYIVLTSYWQGLCSSRSAENKKFKQLLKDETLRLRIRDESSDSAIAFFSCLTAERGSVYALWG